MSSLHQQHTLNSNLFTQHFLGLDFVFDILDAIGYETQVEAPRLATTFEHTSSETLIAGIAVLREILWRKDSWLEIRGICSIQERSIWI